MNKMNKMPNSELQSKIIDFLRFPLIVGVVFIHNNSSTMIVQGVEIGNSTNLPMYYIASNLFSQVIGSIAVPLFFFISGFLFFLNKNFNLNVYKRKLQSRVHTLFIPYLFWNLAVLLFCYIATMIPILSSGSKSSDYNLMYILESLWGRSNTAEPIDFPIDFQFWFIRDLMVVVVLSPFIYWFLKKTKCYGVIFIGILWYLGYTIPYIGRRGLSMFALFFFTMGAWYSIRQKNLIDEFYKFRYWYFIGYLLVAIGDLCTKEQNYNIYIHNIGIIVGILCCFNLSHYLIEKKGIKESPFLAASSFFIFAVHVPWLLPQLKKVLFVLLKPKSDAMLTLLYFVIVIIVVLVALLLYYLLKRTLPRFTAFITGGRI